jgi:hypothetical protein
VTEFDVTPVWSVNADAGIPEDVAEPDGAEVVAAGLAADEQAADRTATTSSAAADVAAPERRRTPLEHRPGMIMTLLPQGAPHRSSTFMATRVSTARAGGCRSV